MGEPNDGALDQAADPGSGNFTAPLGCPVAQADSTDDAFLKKLQSRGVVILDEDGAEQAIGVAQEPPEGAGRPSATAYWAPGGQGWLNTSTQASA
jgi:hypothetical protein